jgi:hypothetical protein
LDAEEQFSPSRMSVEMHVEQALGGGGRRAGSLLTPRTNTPPPAPHSVSGADPLAGEDEPWAEEDFLWTPDDDEYVGFLRALWLAVFACALFWVAIAIGAARLLGLS